MPIKMVSVCACVIVCDADACGVWQDSAEHSEEPSDLLCPVCSQHLFWNSGGTHLLPDALYTARGVPEQVQYV